MKKTLTSLLVLAHLSIANAAPGATPPDGVVDASFNAVSTSTLKDSTGVSLASLLPTTFNLLLNTTINGILTVNGNLDTKSGLVNTSNPGGVELPVWIADPQGFGIGGTAQYPRLIFDGTMPRITTAYATIGTSKAACDTLGGRHVPGFFPVCYYPLALGGATSGGVDIQGTLKNTLAGQRVTIDDVDGVDIRGPIVNLDPLNLPVTINDADGLYVEGGNIATNRDIYAGSDIFVEQDLEVKGTTYLGDQTTGYFMFMPSSPLIVNKYEPSTGYTAGTCASAGGVWVAPRCHLPLTLNGLGGLDLWNGGIKNVNGGAVNIADPDGLNVQGPLVVNGNFSVNGNLWNGITISNIVTPGTTTSCTNGQFMTGIQTNAAGQVTSIRCNSI